MQRGVKRWLGQLRRFQCQHKPNDAYNKLLGVKSLIGQPALLELLTSQSRTALRPFHGHITRAELLGSDGGLARYRLVIEP